MDDFGCIFFDVEMRKDDQYPALVGVLVDEEFTITCLEEGLRPAAEHAGLEVVNPHEFFTALLLKAEEEDRALVAYTLHEFEILEKMFDDNSDENMHLLDILNRRYVNANARKWFRKHYRESYDMIEVVSGPKDDEASIGRRTEAFEWASTCCCKFLRWLILVRMKQAEAHRQTP